MFVSRTHLFLFDLFWSIRTMILNERMVERTKENYLNRKIYFKIKLLDDKAELQQDSYSFHLSEWSKIERNRNRRIQFVTKPIGSIETAYIRLSYERNSNLDSIRQFRRVNSNELKRFTSLNFLHKNCKMSLS